LGGFVEEVSPGAVTETLGSNQNILLLNKQALEVLAMLRELAGQNEWLFPGDRNAKKPMSNNTILKALERMGYKGRMTGHGFRGLASTILHEQGYAHEHIELQLAHAPRNAVSADDPRNGIGG
jgi:integrase